MARSEVRDIPLALIDPSPAQPRGEFPEDSLEELAVSLKGVGLLQRVIVRPIGDRFQLIAGERRWRAAQRARFDVIPAEIRHGLSDDEAAEMALVENLLREDLKPLDVARHIQRYVAQPGKSIPDFAKRLGKSPSWAKNLLRLLELPPELQRQVDAGELPQRIARVLVPYADRPEVIAAAMESRRMNPRNWEDTDTARVNVNFLAMTFDELAAAPVARELPPPGPPRLQVVERPAERLLRDRDVRELLKPYANSAADLAAIVAAAEALLAKLS